LNAVTSQTWRLNPQWLDEPSWPEVLARATKLTEAERVQALEWLKKVFDLSWSTGRTLAHGVTHKQFTYPGRLSLLELGRAAALTGVDDSFLGRLRDPGEYFGADAELRAALLLMSGGAVLEREKAGDGSRLSEYVARWPSGEAAIVEVKAVRMSDKVQAAERLTTQCVFALMGRADELPGYQGQLAWNEDALFKSLQDTPVEVVLSEINMAFDRLKDHIGDGPRSPFDWPLGSIGSLRLALKQSAPALDLAFDGYAPSAEVIFRRLRRRCNDALQQLATHPHLPGLIILDADADGLARNGLRQLAGWARQKPQLGAVLVTEREYGAEQSYTHVCVLPGPRLGDVVYALAALEECDKGHLHFQPLTELTKPCSACSGFR
jgi:hypothetical protein